MTMTASQRDALVGDGPDPSDYTTEPALFRCQKSGCGQETDDVLETREGWWCKPCALAPMEAEWTEEEPFGPESPLLTDAILAEMRLLAAEHGAEWEPGEALAEVHVFRFPCPCGNDADGRLWHDGAYRSQATCGCGQVREGVL